MKVSVFDYGAGNLHSLVKALATRARADVQVVEDPLKAIKADALVLPGVGAFGAATERLAKGRTELRAAAADGLPILGICLGMQLFFDRSEEGSGEGLGIIAGEVTKLRAPRVPQIGWNALEQPADALLDRSGLRIAYYANGYVCRPDDASCVRAWSEHGGDRFPAVVRQGRVVGTQFHPEKSSAPGVALLHAFLEEAER
jgi:glutamine amidotransferase